MDNLVQHREKIQRERRLQVMLRAKQSAQHGWSNFQFPMIFHHHPAMYLGRKEDQLFGYGDLGMATTSR